MALFIFLSHTLDLARAECEPLRGRAVKEKERLKNFYKRCCTMERHPEGQQAMKKYVP